MSFLVFYVACVAAVCVALSLVVKDGRVKDRALLWLGNRSRPTAAGAAGDSPNGTNGLATVLAGLAAKGPRTVIADDLGEVLALAGQVFASESLRRHWLTMPCDELGHVSPLVAALQPGGPARVRDMVASRAQGEAVARLMRDQAPVPERKDASASRVLLPASPAAQLRLAVAGASRPTTPPSITDDLGVVLRLAHALFDSDPVEREWLSRMHTGMDWRPPLTVALRPGGAQELRALIASMAQEASFKDDDPLEDAQPDPGRR